MIESVTHRTERSRTGSLEDFTNAQCTTIPDHAGGCVDPTTIEYPLKECDTGAETSVKIESVKNECALECADGADLDQSTSTAKSYPYPALRRNEKSQPYDIDFPPAVLDDASIP